MRMCGIWPVVLALACAGVAAGCAASNGRQGDGHAPRGAYVGGAGGYVVH